MCFAKNAVAIFISLLLSIVPHSAKAQNALTLTGTFERITNVDEITSADYFLIGSWAQFGNASTRTFNLATTSFLSSNKKKLKALPYANGPEKHIVCKDSTLVWKIKKGENSYVITSAESDKVLSRITNDGLGLLLDEYKSKFLSEWTIVSNSGTFVVSFAQNGKRKLICDYANDTSICFDNYVDGEPLYLYKQISTNIPEQSTIEVLPNGTNVALIVDDGAYSTNTPGTISTDGFLLTDGTYTSDGEFSTFVCETSSDLKAFSLKSSNGTHFLSTNFTLTSEPTLWQLRDGKLVEYSSTDDISYACYSAKRHQWLLLTKEEQKEQTAQYVTMGIISPPPTSSLSGDGTMSLSGGWSANALSQLNFGDATCLDMTGIPLPLKGRSFENKPSTSNFPIFISYKTTSAVPDEWKFVVIADANEYYLSKDTQLTDKESFNSPYDITLRDAQMTYTRKPIEGTVWQTVCIPFGVSELPTNALFYSVQEQSNSELILKNVTSLEAGKPYLFRSTNEENGFSSAETLEFKSKEGTILDKPSNNKGLQGNYSLFKVQSNGCDIFMLHPATSTFQRAAVNSTLKPFRAFLSSASNTVKVRIIQ